MPSRHMFPFLLSLLLTLSACSQEPPAANAQAPPPDASGELADDEEKTLYAVGVAMSQGLGPFNLSEEELAIVLQGLRDGVLKREPKVDMQTFGPKIQAFAQGRAAQAAGAEKEQAAGFLEKMAAEPGARRTDSGLIFTEITAGTGASPQATDTVKVHYHGTLRDGTVFDSSVDRGEPATFPLNRVISCWTEGVQLMKVGGKAKLVCPSEIAYGDRGAPPKIPPGAALAFEVELLEIVSGDE